MAADEALVEGRTRERLLNAGMRLFAEKGFRGTTVGEIESAVGLQPRRGALYKHFASKQELLEAAAQRHFDAVDQAARVTGDVEPVDVRAEALALGRWLLAELESERDLTRIIEKDGDLMPEVREQARERISDAGYRATAVVIRRWAGDDSIDAEALAVNILSPLINFRRSTWTFGATPLGLDDDRMVTAWADMCVRLVGVDQ